MIREYTTTYIWLTGAVLLIVKNLYENKGMETVRHFLMVILISLVVLLSGYLFVRFMKKSKRWVAD